MTNRQVPWHSMTCCGSTLNSESAFHVKRCPTSRLRNRRQPVDNPRHPVDAHAQGRRSRRWKTFRCPTDRSRLPPLGTPTASGPGGTERRARRQRYAARIGPLHAHDPGGLEPLDLSLDAFAGALHVDVEHGERHAQQQPDVRRRWRHPGAAPRARCAAPEVRRAPGGDRAPSGRMAPCRRPRETPRPVTPMRAALQPSASRCTICSRRVAPTCWCCPETATWPGSTSRIAAANASA